jgi:hypothetical protein
MSGMNWNGFQCTCAATLRPGFQMLVFRDHCPIHSPRANVLRDLSPMGGGPAPSKSATA